MGCFETTKQVTQEPPVFKVEGGAGKAYAGGVDSVGIKKKED